MQSEEITAILNEIESDITYFKNLGFDHLVEKFNRDLNVIKKLSLHSTSNV